MEFTYILTGGIVGLIIGLTGVGGGSLMTPALIIGFGINPIIAVGTDLLYAAITKSGGVLIHHHRKHVNWTIVLNLAAGSIPACLITLYCMQHFNISTDSYNTIISRTLSIMLILTALVIIAKNRLSSSIFRLTMSSSSRSKERQVKLRFILTIISGMFLGTVVSISSVGAGAIGTAILFTLYPSYPSVRIIGTDLAHAVPLTAIAGLGHLSQQHVSFPLLFGLLAGGIPMVYLGASLGKKLSDEILRKIVAAMLFSLGVKLALQ